MWDFPASSDFLAENNMNTGVSSVPLTIAAFVQLDTVVSGGCICNINDTTGYTNVFGLNVKLLTGSTWQAQAQADLGVANSSTSAGLNEVYHAAAVFESTTSRHAYLQGAGKVTDTSLQTPSGGGQLRAAQNYLATGLDGKIGELAIWNAALSDAEILSLAQGVPPNRIRPGLLDRYYTFRGTPPVSGYANGYDGNATRLRWWNSPAEYTTNEPYLMPPWDLSAGAVYEVPTPEPGFRPLLSRQRALGTHLRM